MTVGEGIFWGSVSLSLVGLYLGTKDRWRWSRILGWGAAGVLGLVGLVAAGLAGNQWYEARPRQFTGMWGIALGASMNDVLVVKGEPTEREKPHLWMFKTNEQEKIHVRFTPAGTVDSIYSYGRPLHMETPDRVSAYTSMEDLNERFGPASAVNDSINGLFRTFTFKQYNLVAAFGGGSMVAIGVESDLSDKGRTYGPSDDKPESATSARK